eukprot:996826-Prymnesium_polylepis.1
MQFSMGSIPRRLPAPLPPRGPLSSVKGNSNPSDIMRFLITSANLNALGEEVTPHPNAMHADAVAGSQR